MKMKCNVIQDLLPSYVDNICSADTKELVDEHVAECAQCKEKLEQMKNTEIVAGKASEKQVDYLKKIRISITTREGLGKVILVILVGIAFVGLFVGRGGLFNYWRIPSVIFSVLIFCAAMSAENYRYSGGKTAAVEIGVSGAVFVFVISSYIYFMRAFLDYEARDGEGPLLFNMIAANQAGPFYVNVLRIAALVPVAVLLWNTFGKRKNAYATTLNITTLSYIVYVNDWLHHMDGPEESIQYIWELSISQIVLAVVGIVIYALLRKLGKMPIGEENL